MYSSCSISISSTTCSSSTANTHLPGCIWSLHVAFAEGEGGRRAENGSAPSSNHPYKARPATSTSRRDNQCLIDAGHAHTHAEAEAEAKAICTFADEIISPSGMRHEARGKPTDISTPLTLNSYPPILITLSQLPPGSLVPSAPYLLRSHSSSALSCLGPLVLFLFFLLLLLVLRSLPPSFSSFPIIPSAQASLTGGRLRFIA